MTAITDIVKSTAKDVYIKSANVVQKGGVFIYPTETLYGLGCSAFSLDAIRRIYEIKKRPYNKPLAVLVRDLHMLERHFVITKKQLEAYASLRDKAVTLVLPQKTSFPEVLTSGKKSVAVRVSSSEFVRALFEHIDVPLVSTSANISDSDNVFDIQEIVRLFSGKVDLIVDSGNLPPSKGSTIIDLTVSPPYVIREGDVKAKELEDLF